MFTLGIIDFPSWLQTEMEERKISQAELSRLSGISPAQISKIINMQSPPGSESCRAIAHALDLPEEEVFRKAGLLSPQVEEPPNLGEWIRMFVLADEEERDRMLEVARTLSRRSRGGNT